jgi:phosphoglycolate phosphatase
MYHYVLFDLDGTLTDPKEGICKSVQYALKEQNIEEPNLDKLEPFIGPPLAASFREFYGMDEEQTNRAVRKFRERFETVGIYENQLYPGMEEFLSSLQQQGIHLAIASSKPRDFVERILEYFKIEEYFEVITGSEKDGRKVEKTEVIREALSKLFQVKEEAVCFENKKEAKRILPVDDILMVGDRKFDIMGAQTFFLHSVGVSYGYAEDGELEQAGADDITDNLDRLYEIIVGERRGQREKTNAWQKSLRILTPIVYAYLITNLTVGLLSIGLECVQSQLLQSYSGWFRANSKQLAVYMDAVATIVAACVLGWIYRKEKPRPISHVVKRRNEKKLLREGIALTILSAAAALFLNILLVAISMSGFSKAYQETADIQYSVPLVVGVFVYSVIKPLEEELVFRGLVYERMRKYFPVRVAVPISALLFGAYHGNLVQLIYGFCMGCLLTWAYERYRKLGASILAHGAANFVVYLTCSLPQVYQIVFSKSGCLLLGIITTVMLIGFYRKVCAERKFNQKTTHKF